MKNIRDAKTKIESALAEATRVTAVKDTNRLQIDFALRPTKFPSNLFKNFEVFLKVDHVRR